MQVGLSLDALQKLAAASQNKSESYFRLNLPALCFVDRNSSVVRSYVASFPQHDRYQVCFNHQCVSCCFVEDINEAYEARIRQHYLRQGLPPPPRRYRVRTSTTKQSLLTSSTATTSSTESTTAAPTTVLATSLSKSVLRSEHDFC